MNATDTRLVAPTTGTMRGAIRPCQHADCREAQTHRVYVRGIGTVELCAEHRWRAHEAGHAIDGMTGRQLPPLPDSERPGARLLSVEDLRGWDPDDEEAPPDTLVRILDIVGDSPWLTSQQVAHRLGMAKCRDQLLELVRTGHLRRVGRAPCLYALADHDEDPPDGAGQQQRSYRRMSSKTDVIAAIRRSTKPGDTFRSGDVSALCPAASTGTVRNALSYMVKAGDLIRHGTTGGWVRYERVRA